MRIRKKNRLGTVTLWRKYYYNADLFLVSVIKNIPQFKDFVDVFIER